MRYRKRPIVVEAEQLTEENGERLAIWCHGEFHGTRMSIMLIDGQTVQAKIGEWIIKGANGEFYPCDADVFAKSYEPA
jgi:hypothetical protein